VTACIPKRDKMLIIYPHMLLLFSHLAQKQSERHTPLCYSGSNRSGSRHTWFRSGHNLA